jgi:hypothetical protein
MNSLQISPNRPMVPMIKKRKYEYLNEEQTRRFKK